METALTPIERAVLHPSTDSARFTIAEAVDALVSLLEKGLIRREDEVKFLRAGDDPLLIVSRGLPVVGGAEVDEESGHRSYFGAGRGEMPEIPFEVFKENRREMSRKYAPDVADE